MHGGGLVPQPGCDSHLRKSLLACRTGGPLLPCGCGGGDGVMVGLGVGMVLLVQKVCSHLKPVDELAMQGNQPCSIGLMPLCILVSKGHQRVAE